MAEIYDLQPDMYLSKKDVEEITEIFHTPLTGSYNWDYSAADDKINRLYQLAKKRQWDVEIDLDWSKKWDINAATLDDYSINHHSYMGYEPYANLSDSDKLEIQHKFATWSLSQFLHGEQGALWSQVNCALAHLHTMLSYMPQHRLMMKRDMLKHLINISRHAKSRCIPLLLI